jgi:hypothetical protein
MDIVSRRAREWWTSVGESERQQFKLLGAGIVFLLSYRYFFGSPHRLLTGAEPPQGDPAAAARRTVVTARTAAREDNQNFYRADSNDEYDYEMNPESFSGSPGLGNLPGDFSGQFGGVYFSFPLMSSLLFSLVLSMFMRFFQQRQVAQAEAEWERRRANPPPRPHRRD